MPITPSMNVQSILGLIASDFSYKNSIQLGDLLETHPDSDTVDESGFPSSLALVLGNEPLTQFTSTSGNGVNGVKLLQWEVVKVTQDSSDGFGVVILKSKIRGIDGKFDYIVALRGSDGFDKQDWFANLDLASTVWRTHSADVVSYLMNQQTTGDIPRLNRIHFTGQSLGGGLAQYAAFDFAVAVKDANLEFRPDDVTLTTFNAFGGVRGLQQLAAADPSRGTYDPSLLKKVATAHYSIDNDIVHRFGRGDGDASAVGGSWHVNGFVDGARNTYRFAFRRFDGGVPVTGERNFLNIVEGHRIESGFYRGFERYGINFTDALPETIEYIDSDSSRSLGAAFSRIGNKGFTTDTSAGVRLAVGAAAIAVAGNPSEIIRAASALATARLNGGQPGDAAIETSVISAAAIGAHLAATRIGAVIGFGPMFAWFLERHAELSGAKKSQAFEALNSFMPANRQIAEITPAPLGDSSNSERDVTFRLSAVLLASQLPDEPEVQALLFGPDEIALARLLRATQPVATRLSEAIISAKPRQALEEYISSALREAPLPSTEKTYLAGSIAGQIQDIANALGADDPAYLSRVREGTNEFLVTLAKTLANASQELLSSAKYADASNPLFANTTLTYTGYRQSHDGFVQAVNDPENASIRTLLSAALEPVELAGQTVVLQAERPVSNPFDATGFDPDAAPFPLEKVGEGSIKRFTLFLPYAAGEGGQQIAVSLDGTAARNVKLLAGGEEAVAHDGIFTVVVEEGHRELELVIWGQVDVAENGTIAVSATLVDAVGQKTHQTHIEGNVEFVARQDAVFEGPPGEGDSGDHDQIVLIQTGISGVYIDFFGGNDIVWADAGEDRLLGGSGDDRLFGSFRVYAGINDQDWLSGGPGNDQLIGGEGDDTLEGDSGSDILLGDVGDDFLFAGSKADYATIFTVGGADLDANTVQGGAGKDLVVGSGGSDALSGGNDADLIFGGAGNDEIRGDTEFVPTHAFQIIGSTFPPVQPLAAGADVLYGNAGSDKIFGEGGNDLLYGGDGDDTLIGGEGNDELYGGAGNDILFGDGGGTTPLMQGSDFLDGGAGDDQLSGEGGADVLIGGAGNDLLRGGDGSDTYVFTRGDGGDLITEQGLGGVDVLVINGYALADVAVWRLATGSVHLIGRSGDTITVSSPLVGAVPGVELVQFANGAVLSLAELADRPIDPDTLGGEGWETLSEGNDTIETWGLPSHPGGFVLVDAGAGNDTVLGDAHAVVYGNAGDDQLFGGDTLIAGDGDDYLSDAVRLIGGEGNDELLNGTILDGGPGNDFLDGGYGASRYLIASSDLGFDIISDSGESQDAFLEDFYSSLGIFDWRERRFPTQLEYVVFEIASFATLEEASAEVDELFGLTWDEAIARGFATVLDPLPSPPQIAAHDWSALAPLYAMGLIEADAVEFAQGINFADLTLSWGEVTNRSPVSGAREAYTTLDVSWGAGSVARIVIPHGEDSLGTGVEEFRFANGWVVSMQGMVAAAPPAPSFDPQFGDNLLIGTALGEGINGRAGNDSIFGGDGDDFLEGGEGTDILRGEDGTDSLSDGQGNNFFDGGTGDDFIHADGGANFITGGAGNDWIGSYAAGNVIAFNIGDGQDTVYVLNALTLSLGGGIDPASLSLSQDFADLVLTIGAGDSIRLTSQSEPQAWPQITLQIFDSVHHYDFNAVIADFYAALAADSSLSQFSLDGVLQSHESNVSETDAIGGPLAYQYGAAGNLGALSDAAIHAVLADPDFGISAQSIQIPGDGNSAPTLAIAIADQVVLEDQPFSFTLPAATFVDADAGEIITIGATLADGSALPQWLSFDAATQNFSGTPANEDVGAFEVTVTATDTGGLSTSDTFQVTVANTNDAPVLKQPLANQIANQNAPFAFPVSPGTFADVDVDDVLSLSATLAEGAELPAWLAFEPAAGTFSGTPSEFDVGGIEILVTATDRAGAATSGTFTLTVSDASAVSETHVGTRRDDDIVTGFANDWIDAGGGDDRVRAGAGRDVILGGRGNDRLAGDAGNDLYFHDQQGGHDVIEETGGLDTLLLGEGITPVGVRLERRRDDLVVDLKGADGSVTVTDWFASDATKVETIQFADGTAWGVDEIHAGVQRKRRERHLDDDHDHVHHHSERDGEHHGKSNGRERDDGDGSRPDHKNDRIADLLEAVLARKPRYDFETLAREIERPQLRGEILDALEIARRWEIIARYASGLANEHDEDARGGAFQVIDRDALVAGREFGSGSFETGWSDLAHGAANLRTLRGLSDGLRILRG